MAHRASLFLCFQHLQRNWAKCIWLEQSAEFTKIYHVYFFQSICLLLSSNNLLLFSYYIIQLCTVWLYHVSWFRMGWVVVQESSVYVWVYCVVVLYEVCICVEDPLENEMVHLQAFIHLINSSINCNNYLLLPTCLGEKPVNTWLICHVRKTDWHVSYIHTPFSSVFDTLVLPAIC